MRKFYRSTKSKYLTGVCGGLGYHTKVDPIIWRAFFLLLLPTSIIAYLVLTILTEKK
jgi:phage shock protein PspC (stress-responsive transcriptional regulator)